MKVQILPHSISHFWLAYKQTLSLSTIETFQYENVMPCQAFCKPDCGKWGKDGELMFYYNSINIVVDSVLHKQLHKLPTLSSPKVLSWCMRCTFLFGVYLYLTTKALLARTSPD